MTGGGCTRRSAYRQYARGAGHTRRAAHGQTLSHDVTQPQITDPHIIKQNGACVPDHTPFQTSSSVQDLPSRIGWGQRLTPHCAGFDAPPSSSFVPRQLLSHPLRMGSTRRRSRRPSWTSVALEAISRRRSMRAPVLPCSPRTHHHLTDYTEQKALHVHITSGMRPESCPCAKALTASRPSSCLRTCSPSSRRSSWAPPSRRRKHWRRPPAARAPRRAPTSSPPWRRSRQTSPCSPSMAAP